MAIKFRKAFYQGVKNHDNFISIMSSMLDKQKRIDSKIAGTNDKIYKSVDMRKKQDAINLQNNLNLEEQIGVICQQN